MKHTLFISDLHLQSQQPVVVDVFRRFMEGQARQAEAVYILGDLFEVWIGDDEASILNRSIQSILKDFTLTGIPLYIMHGNRDFLLGKAFAEQVGCQLISDPTSIQLYGQSILLKHGDDLCTDDTRHIQFRKKTHNKAIQKMFLCLPLGIRRRIANKIRRISRFNTQSKPMVIMDVNQEAVEQVMQAARVTVLIHGHTHRPAVHVLQVNGQAAQRIVLGAWHEQGNALIYHDSGDRALIYFS